MRAIGWLGTALGVSVVAFAAWLAVGVGSGRVQVPDRWNPWAPLDLRAEPHRFTGLQLARAQRDPERCEAIATTQLLPPAARGGLEWQARRVPDRAAADGCGFSGAWAVERTSLAVGTPFVVTCPVALALAMWERHTLQPAAREHLSSDVVRIVHLGSYACRNRYGRPTGERSLHATAQALDVAGFELRDGRRVSLRAHWNGADGRAAFLRAAHAGACRWFDGVLGPDYNAAHEDHLHLEVGGGRFCPQRSAPLPAQPGATPSASKVATAACSASTRAASAARRLASALRRASTRSSRPVRPLR